MRRASLVLLLAIALLAVACGGTATPAAQQPAPTAQQQSPAQSAPPAPAAGTSGGAEDKLARAKAEGTVVWYTSLAQKDAEEIGKNFEQKTGIKIQINRLSAGAMWDRIQREKSANIDAVDLADTGGPWYHLQAKQDGLLMKYSPEGSESIAKEFKDADGFFTSGWLAPPVIEYNTKIIPAAEAPKSYKDAMDPKWKGKIAHASPIHSGSALEQAAQLVELYGWDYYKKLKANDVMIVQSHLAPAQTAVSGERAFAVGTSAPAAYQVRAEGNPVEIVWPSDRIIPSAVNISLFAKAPHPNAAKVFADYLFSKETQGFLAKQWWIGTLPGVEMPAGIPKIKDIDFYPLDYVKLMKTQQEFKEQWKDIFGG